VRYALVALVLIGCGGPAPTTPKPSGAPLETSSLPAITQGPGARWAIVGSPRALFAGALAPYVNKLIPKQGMDKLATRLGFDLRLSSAALMVGFTATTFYAARLPDGTAPSSALDAFEKRIIPKTGKSTPRADLVRLWGDMPAGAQGSAAGMWSTRGDTIVGEGGRLGPVLVSMALAAGKLSPDRALSHDKTFAPLLAWAGNADIAIYARCPLAETLGAAHEDDAKRNVLLAECFGIGITIRPAPGGKLAIATRIAGAWGKDADLAGDETRATISRVAESDLGRVIGVRDAKTEIKVTPAAIDATLILDAETFVGGLARILSAELSDATK
jgi:hypothetical protein